MDLLRTKMAPISEAAWNQINEQARRFLHTNLSIRKFVDVSGPHGWEYSAVPEGRLNIPKNQPAGEVSYGVHRVQPLIETRIPFELDVWELDNAVRGAQDIELGTLEQAAKKIALFEEKAIYDGFEEGALKGLRGIIEHDKIPLSPKPENFLEGVSKGITTLLSVAVEGPYALVVSPEIWRILANYSEGYPLKKHVEKLLDGPVIYSAAINDAFLVSLRGGDMELVIGQDFSIGYLSHTPEKVKLYFTESFTFRVFDPTVMVNLELKK
jgi:uncharacterized linocin/CFP29 family protein